MSLLDIQFFTASLHAFFIACLKKYGHFLLKIWNRSILRSDVKKFCKDHFLSFSSQKIIKIWECLMLGLEPQKKCFSDQLYLSFLSKKTLNAITDVVLYATISFPSRCNRNRRRKLQFVASSAFVSSTQPLLKFSMVPLPRTVLAES